jgi:hypothetical protein
MERSKRRARAIAIAKTEDTNRLQTQLVTLASAASLVAIVAVAALKFI